MEILCRSFSRVTTLKKRWFSLKFPNSLFFLIFTGHVDYEVEHIYKPKKLKKTPHFSIYLLYGGLTWLQKFRCLQVGQGCSYLPSFAGTPPDLNGYILYVISGIWLRCFLVQPLFVATAFSLSLPAGRAISASNYQWRQNLYLQPPNHHQLLPFWSSTRTSLILTSFQISCLSVSLPISR